MLEGANDASILAVDDTVENLRLLTSMLGEYGLEVRPVTSGRQALQAATHDPPDLILLDITMPEMDGYETCARLKEIEGLADVPVIFLTALGEVADKVRAFEVGGADYVTKPFQIEEVVARVRVHLALRRARLELANNYEKLAALERLRDDLVHMIVHDMRSPLTVIVANVGLLLSTVADQLDAESVIDLEKALGAARVLTRMTHDLLDVSRLEHGEMPLDRRSHDLVGIARGVCSALSGWERGRIIEVEGSGPVEVSCDGGIVERVLENLVGNALKHTSAEGRIRIEVTAEPDRARVAVCDEGPGVPPDARERIFEKFQSRETRKDRKHHSAGLGLAFCKLAVEAHGGRIGVDDGSPRGSVFWFELPVVSRLAAPVAPG